VFEDVPPEISKWVGAWAFGAFTRRARQKVAVAGAFGVIRHYLGQDWLNRLEQNSITPELLSRHGKVSYRRLNFTVTIGETLFLLRNSPAFPEICRRLKTRDLRAAYYEMYVTRSFLDYGYQIYARPETGIKRDDFDFEAAKGSEHVNVEVTALEPKPFADGTLLNALQQKRAQLPDTAPAVIFVILPERWDNMSIDLNAHVELTAERFLVGTRRINAVMVGVQRHVDDRSDSAKGIYVFIVKRFLNKRPRIAAEGLTSMFVHGPSFSDAMAKSVRREVRLEISDLPSSDIKVTRDSEFYRWIDYLCDRSGFIDD